MPIVLCLPLCITTTVPWRILFFLFFNFCIIYSGGTEGAKTWEFGYHLHTAGMMTDERRTYTH
jgi:hypothetical protein